MMFGWGEVGLITVLAIILLGPDKLADLARTAGKIYAEYQKAKRRLEIELLYGEVEDERLREIQRRKVEEITLDIRESLNSERSMERG